VPCDTKKDLKRKFGSFHIFFFVIGYSLRGDFGTIELAEARSVNRSKQSQEESRMITFMVGLKAKAKSRSCNSSKKWCAAAS
jgi:hypothetical protein